MPDTVPDNQWSDAFDTLGGQSLDLGNGNTPQLTADSTSVPGVFQHEAIAYNSDLLWVVILGFVIAFILAFAVGANDVANSFGTSVGSKVLTLRQACIMAVIFESLGACLLGSQVSDTIWKEIVDIKMYEGEEKTLMLGECAALIGTATWLLLATLLKIPVSGTHAIVGATMGFSIVKHGYSGIQWLRIVRIVASWFVSPVLAGAISAFLFILIRRFILKSANPLESGLRALPIFYGTTIFINLISIFLGGAVKIPWWAGLIVSVGIPLIVGLAVWRWLVPWKRRTVVSNVRRLRATTVVPIMCAMNCSVATNLDSLDELAYGTEEKTLNELGTSTTTLDVLGDTDEMGQEEQEEDEEEATLTNEPTCINISEATVTFSQDGAATRTRLRSILRKRSYVYQPPPPPPVTEPEEAAENGLRRDYEKEDFLPPPNYNLRVMRYSRANQGNLPISPMENANGSALVKTMDMQRTSDNGRKQEKLSCCVRCWRAVRTLGQGNEDKDSLKPPVDPPEIAAIFSFLQILTATFTAFAHGGNDVSNAIGPVVAIWVIYTNGHVPVYSSTPIWLLLFGGLGISVGLCVLGRKVIETVGNDLAVIIPSSGFCIGLGTASTVLLCSKVGLPVSTTHCIVGSVVAVGYLRSSRAVNWKVFGNIMGCALFTVPFAGACSAGAMALLGLLP